MLNEGTRGAAAASGPQNTSCSSSSAQTSVHKRFRAGSQRFGAVAGGTFSLLTAAEKRPGAKASKAGSLARPCWAHRLQGPASTKVATPRALAPGPFRGTVRCSAAIISAPDCSANPKIFRGNQVEGGVPFWNRTLEQCLSPALRRSRLKAVSKSGSTRQAVEPR